MKKCSKCGKEYPTTLEYFHRQTGKKDNLTSACKDCRNCNRFLGFVNDNTLLLFRFIKYLGG